MENSASSHYFILYPYVQVTIPYHEIRFHWQLTYWRASFMTSVRTDQYQFCGEVPATWGNPHAESRSYDWCPRSPHSETRRDLKKQGRTLIFREASLFFQSPLPLISAVLQAILPISCGSTKALPKMTGRAAGFAHSRENRNVRESSFRHAGRFSYYNCDSITAFLLFPTNRLFVEAPSCLIFYILSFSANPVLRIPPPRPVQKKAYVLPLIEKSYVNL